MTARQIADNVSKPFKVLTPILLTALIGIVGYTWQENKKILSDFSAEVKLYMKEGYADRRKLDARVSILEAERNFQDTE